MRYVILAIGATTLLVACNGEPQVENETSGTAETAVEMPAVDPNAKIDPVCDMIKDDTWTEYSVSGTDTTWFCSETCKTAYDANPAKYAKK